MRWQNAEAVSMHGRVLASHFSVSCSSIQEASSLTCSQGTTRRQYVNLLQSAHTPSHKRPESDPPTRVTGWMLSVPSLSRQVVEVPPCRANVVGSSSTAHCPMRLMVLKALATNSGFECPAFVLHEVAAVAAVATRELVEKRLVADGMPSLGVLELILFFPSSSFQGLIAQDFVFFSRASRRAMLEKDRPRRSSLSIHGRCTCAIHSQVANKTNNSA